MADEPKSSKSLSEVLRAATGPPLTRRQELLQSRVRERNQQNVQLAIDWLRKRWTQPTTPCPYCNKSDWRVGTPVDIATDRGAPLSPHFPVMCGYCGHTVFINALIAGVVPGNE